MICCVCVCAVWPEYFVQIQISPSQHMATTALCGHLDTTISLFPMLELGGIGHYQLSPPNAGDFRHLDMTKSHFPMLDHKNPDILAHGQNKTHPTTLTKSLISMLEWTKTVASGHVGLWARFSPQGQFYRNQ